MELTFSRPDRIQMTSVVLPLLLVLLTGPRAYAASTKGCEGGAFTIQTNGTPLSATGTIPVAALGPTFSVIGKYVTFQVTSSTFEVLHYTLTGAPNQLDLTGGKSTEVFAAKTPNLLGLILTSNVDVQIDAESLVLGRSGAGVSMKIQANDCATGGIFQMEPSRGDGLPTDITHSLAPNVFYFDNPNFRAQANNPTLPLCSNGVFTPACVPVAVTPRINFANNISRNLVGRDSPQAATRITNVACRKVFPGPGATTQNVDHCGNVSVWRVTSGGRMGGVMGEDSVEVAPPAVTCTHQCQAQDQVRGKFPVLGFPFPVPAADILPFQP